MSIPRSEHPRPQFFRKTWLTLNGQWSCALDQTNSGNDCFWFDSSLYEVYGQNNGGTETLWQNSKGFDQPINVPFAPESKLSGIGHTDFINGIWYHRNFSVPAEWQNKEILLHFGGVNYKSIIYLDGVEVFRHVGGSSPFTVNITAFAAAGSSHDLVVYAQNDVRSGLQGSGKQSPWVKNRLCNYTRTTGIWQSVWLEAADKYALASCRIVPDFDNGAFCFYPELFNQQNGLNLTINVLADGVTVASKRVKVSNGAAIVIELPAPQPWTPQSPFLYDVEYILRDAQNNIVDKVKSYAGLRKIHLENGKYYLNNQPVFLRMVLDQSFYEDGIWTAPDDESLKRDISLAMAAGFNGARLHQKIFDERFHYWADKLGYLTWAEFPDWGISFWQTFRKCNPDYMRAFRDYYAEWVSVIKRDINHPSIITWTPFNETREMYDLAEHRRIISDIYDLTRSLDPTRPVNDTSGYTHAKTDVWTVHCYQQTSEELNAALNEKPVNCFFPDKEIHAWHGQPLSVDEYGGVAFIPSDRKPYADNSWGYNQQKLTQEEAESRINELTLTLVNHPHVCGYCYTQLTDIEQEQNGIYNYDRTPKFNMDFIRKCFSAKPEWSVF